MAQELEALDLMCTVAQGVCPHVYVAGQHIPGPDDNPPAVEPDELIVLDLVTATGIGGAGTTKRFQATAYAKSRTRSLQLADELRTALRGAQFGFIGQRRALDPDKFGELMEYRR